jgi:DNA-binding MarR family transcriptional regulator
VPYIEIDYEIANFHLSSVKNGFVAGTMINFFNGQPTEEEQEAIEEKIQDKFCGTDNANKILLNFNDSKEQAAEILRMDGNDFDKRFDILNDTVRQEIFTGHRIVDPALFGIQEQGLFTNRTQIRDSYELFKNTYVNGRQRFIESIFNGLASLAGFEKRLIIQDSEPISESFSEATKVGVMTRDEIRAELGLPPITTEQVATELKLAKQDENEEVKLCKYFAACGLSLDEYEIVKPVKKVRFHSNEQMLASENLVKRFGFAEDAVLFGVLEQLKQNPLITYAALAEAFGIEIAEVATIVQELIYRNFLTIAAEVVEGSAMRALTVTPQGINALASAKPLEVTYQVAYRYVLSGEASGPEVLDTTRDFCRSMVGQSKSRVWTSKQIMDIGISEDRNVWLRRGGFWTRKGTDITTPYCRHAWEQVVVRKR